MFGTNISEIKLDVVEAISTYTVSTVILTVLTAWVVVALRVHIPFHRREPSIVGRIAWPVFHYYDLIMMYHQAASLRQPGYKYCGWYLVPYFMDLWVSSRSKLRAGSVFREVTTG